MVADAIVANAGIPKDMVEIVPIQTTGDKVLDRPLAELGGKGLFTKEIETGLLDETLDCAVHSAKDLETILPSPLTLGAFMKRADVRDVFIGRGGLTLSELPEGATVGTASLRRQALVRRERPDLKVEVLRGNVQTRLSKLDAGVCDGTLLALAGLIRLDMVDVASEILSLDRFPPACAQGAIVVEIRRDDDRMIDILAKINDPETEHAVGAERGFLAALDGSCRTPIAGHATITGDRLDFAGLVATPDGLRIEEIEGNGAVADAAEIGYDLGHRLRARIGPYFFEG
ncbi:hydroxymethylbilane synthase [Acuticoccus sp. M5D2P5]|nr:hydroxymethylbilane synthase [Acuticoccus kalidii]